MQVVIVVLLLLTVVNGCSVVKLYSFEELFSESEIVITGKIIKGPVWNLNCPDKGGPIYITEYAEVDENGTEIRLVSGLDLWMNATFVAQVSCVHKGTIACYTPHNDGYKVAGVGSVFAEQCLVYVYRIIAYNSCSYYIEFNETEYTLFMKSNQQVPVNASNKLCFDSTFALKQYQLQSINKYVPETCPYPPPPLPDCPQPECFDAMFKACCGKSYDCFVPNLNLDYKYLDRCGQEGKQYFESKDSVVEQCVCN